MEARDPNSGPSIRCQEVVTRSTEERQQKDSHKRESYSKQGFEYRSDSENDTKVRINAGLNVTGPSGLFLFTHILNVVGSTQPMRRRACIARVHVHNNNTQQISLYMLANSDPPERRRLECAIAISSRFRL